MEINPAKFMGFHGVSMAPSCPPTNNVKLKEFIELRWE